MVPNMNGLRVAVVGATGMVGKMMIQILEERKIPVTSLFLFASARGAGTKISYRFADPVGVRELTARILRPRH
jgi:aspartate-semialdehyde dehydrogenase